MACAPTAEDPSAARRRVVCSIAPLASVVETVAGDLAGVKTILPAGASPESWAATPAAMVAVAEADLLMLVGHPEFVFEARLERQAEEAGAVVIRLADQGEDRNGDPHLWLDLDLMAGVAVALSARLAELEPAGASGLAERSGRFVARVDDLDTRLEALFANRRNARLIVQHPAWERLLRRYGIEEVALEQNGKRVTPERLGQLIGMIEASDIRLLVAQKGFSDRGLRTLARETGASVITLDPLAGDWLPNLESSARELAEVLE